LFVEIIGCTANEPPFGNIPSENKITLLMTQPGLLTVTSRSTHLF
jgi:hypothetical protein